METLVYTVGHSTRALAPFLDLLREAEVRLVADVRRYPTSRRHPWFSSPALGAALRRAGIAYEHLEPLGGHRQRPDAEVPFAGLEPRWRGYAAHMNTPEFAAALDRLLTLARAAGPVAALCAERDPARCHRHLLADALAFRGARVVHLLDPGRRDDHGLHPRARALRGRLVYPAESLGLFD
jgi:uncharacterized protein (DUF488 family)